MLQSQETKRGKRLRSSEKKDSLPIKITLVDKDDTVTDYILIRIDKDKFISIGRNQPADYVQFTAASIGF